MKLFHEEAFLFFWTFLYFNNNFDLASNQEFVFKKETYFVPNIILSWNFFFFEPDRCWKKILYLKPKLGWWFLDFYTCNKHSSLWIVKKNIDKRMLLQKKDLNPLWEVGFNAILLEFRQKIDISFHRLTPQFWQKM